ncbi:RNA polymerase sigma factor [Flavilitoribacter nigricans]|uniref:RNA polymerase subunit sigma n=1 Tax=Flavilitoribacter nigricans (strain ATCC 23147 / DSM 23189 / NBRC 102662 / NCIMB 1420 / SS-2) TaxID=1122177 RepID=A0A2D0N044_FLAN2|nr:RNA polymerase subunit sigma [Flavilitoribacter nigricans DSM 23189 = NBRC 102662]
MEQADLIPHLFRTEFSKITAVLCKHFGLHQIEVAEDIAGDTFAAALETWPHRGIPANPSAWLYTVAKNKTKNLLQRDQLFTNKIAPQLQPGPERPDPDIDWSEANIQDSQLRMLFAICDPVIPQEAQIALALRILCGFGIDEIANALLANKDTINKRLYRAREKLRREKKDLSFPENEDLEQRLATVLTTLYLLFSEGYYSESREAILREDLCLEAMRLTYLLLAFDSPHRPSVMALLALMCFHSSRFPARKQANGAMVLYEDQDRSLWNQELISRGVHYLREASGGHQLSKYHIEANIAYWHTRPEESPEKWENILQLYNRLLQIAYSPIAALNRTFALAKARGYDLAIREAEKLQLEQNHFYFVLLGELYRELEPLKAKEALQRALDLAGTDADRELISRKIDQLG